MQSKAQFVRFLISGTPGVLTSDNGRLTFHTEDNEKILDVPFEEISGVRPSWVGYGSLLVLRASGKKYAFRMTDREAAGTAVPNSDFMRQGIDQEVRELSAIAKAKNLVKEWCQHLKKVGNG